jgi:ketosteroid isomerase-like protein
MDGYWAAMSQENVELVRRFVTAFTRRDDEAVLALADPEIEFHSDLLEQQSFRGHAGLGEYRQTLDDAWSDWRFEDNRLLDAGEGRVLQLYRAAFHGRGSGIPVELDGAILWSVKASKVVSGIGFLDQGKALEAAGLRK